MTLDLAEAIRPRLVDSWHLALPHSIELSFGGSLPLDSSCGICSGQNRARV